MNPRCPRFVHTLRSGKQHRQTGSSLVACWALPSFAAPAASLQKEARVRQTPLAALVSLSLISPSIPREYPSISRPKSKRVTGTTPPRLLRRNGPATGSIYSFVLCTVFPGSQAACAGQDRLHPVCERVAIGISGCAARQFLVLCTCSHRHLPFGTLPPLPRSPLSTLRHSLSAPPRRVWRTAPPRLGRFGSSRPPSCHRLDAIQWPSPVAQDARRRICVSAMVSNGFVWIPGPVTGQETISSPHGARNNQVLHCYYIHRCMSTTSAPVPHLLQPPTHGCEGLDLSQPARLALSPMPPSYPAAAGRLAIGGLVRGRGRREGRGEGGLPTS